MQHGKANELIGTSVVSFEEALERILQRANKTLRGIHTMEVVSKTVSIEASGELEFQVRALLKFAMTPPDLLHL
ncbi:MAG: dodecin domain-containing protein [Gammaproteobacteria bacterium]|nr:dodecin domain-containing protein [Gammaproteobacteria bacterium]MBQ0838701.1 dodecin domain-containing protein [Gammaproteobacteria bacterium]